ncbi:MAG: galactokinase, partial [Calditrichaeota bacterium]|nr:galactokinase [Calditrichota bacterium]
YDGPFSVDLTRLEVVTAERETTAALIRGIAARFRELGYRIGGFNACLTSAVLPGSGLSSSAAVEVLIGTIFNVLFNDGTIPPETIAAIGQYAENHHFGKPCGLMDQMACAVGGIVHIDFKDPQQPLVEKVDFDFAAQQYRLLVVNTGGSHADLTADYAAIPAEMKAVARALGTAVCRDIMPEDLLMNMAVLREQVGDRALLRALHFLGDNERVTAQVTALKAGDFSGFLQLVRESGNSSFKWLQNIYSGNDGHEQGVALALALSEQYIATVGQGACRVHGGGFAGTIQVYLPERAVPEYVKQIEAVFGPESAMVLNIRPLGAVHISDI